MVPKRMNSAYFGDPTFPLALARGWHFWFLVKFLDNCRMDCHEIWYRYLCACQDELYRLWWSSYFSPSAILRSKCSFTHYFFGTNNCWSNGIPISLSWLKTNEFTVCRQPHWDAYMAGDSVLLHFCTYKLSEHDTTLTTTLLGFWLAYFCRLQSKHMLTLVPYTHTRLVLSISQNFEQKLNEFQVTFSLSFTLFFCRHNTCEGQIKAMHPHSCCHLETDKQRRPRPRPPDLFLLLRYPWLRLPWSVKLKTHSWSWQGRPFCSWLDFWQMEEQIWGFKHATL